MNRTVLIAIIGSILLLVALGLNFWLNQNEQIESPPASQVGEDTSEKSAKPVPEVHNDKVATSLAPDSTLDKMTPSFDVVRIAENGDTVIAGRAPSHSEVTILDGNDALGKVNADANGEWVFVPNEALASGSRELSLRAILSDGSILFSENVVILVVPEKGMDIAGRPSETPSQPLALLVPRAGKEGVSKILQKPSVAGSVETETGDLSLDSIDYDDEGKLSLVGRGLPGFNIQVYIDNDYRGGSTVPQNGIWRIQPKENIEPGIYKLRIDKIKDKTVFARLELPFSRSEPLKDFTNNAFIVVQPGNSLWRIARKTLGEGTNYTVLYEANREQIRDPDLIYPGQIFEVPAD